MPNNSNFTPEQIQEILDIFFENFAHRQYIGARYVPIFGRKDEDSIIWDNTGTYEPLTIVLYQGNSYTSRQFVPVGVDILNQEYWANTGNYNAQIEAYRQEVQRLGEEVDEIESKVNAATFSFESVADMKASELLFDGAICHTAGFHTVGDGGAAWYEISDTGTANEMDVIACGELFAALVINTNVNLACLGATEENDISPYFNRALEIKNEVPIIVNAGVYDIQTPIELKTTDRVIHNGFVVYRPTTIAFNINGDQRGGYNPTENNALHGLFSGDVFTIWADRFNNTGKIGMIISEDSTVTKRSFIIENCNFIGLEVGFIDSAIRSYLYEFKHCQFQYCDVCYQYGKSGLTKDDSGENILFDYCVFANSGVCVNLFADAIVLSLFKCSYDFCRNVFSDNSPNGYHVIKVIAGHFEGIGSPTTQAVPATVLYGRFSRTLINFIGANVLITNKHKFSEGLENYGHALVLSGSTSAPKITIGSCSFTFTNELQDFSVYIGDYVNCTSNKNTFRQNSIYLPSAIQACTPFFDNDEVGNITVSEGRASLKFYDIEGAENSTLSIETNSEINKNVVRFATGATRPYFYTKKISGVAGKLIAVNWLSDTLSVGGVAVEITFNDDTTQDITPYQHRPADTPTNVFKFNDTSWGILRLPNNVKYIKARAVLPANTNGIFGGIIVAIVQ